MVTHVTYSTSNLLNIRHVVYVRLLMFRFLEEGRNIATLTSYKGMQGHQLSQELSKDRNKEQLK